MIAGMLFDEEDWKYQAVCPYLAPFMAEAEAVAVCKAVYNQCYLSCVPRETQVDICKRQHTRSHTFTHVHTRSYT